MEKLIIEGGKPLSGTVRVSGAKNASLPILAATILADGAYRIDNVPNLRDISTMYRLLGELGITTEADGDVVNLVNDAACAATVAPYELVKTMRASVLVLGPLLAKCGTAKVSLPGGCAIGERPVDLHIKALAEMGANIEIAHGYIEASCERLKGAHVHFDTVTVTGTENIMMAATLADGVTTITNAAREPEVVDLANFLIRMGADISGVGTATVTITGKESLAAADYSVMSDRIEAGTFLCAVACAGGDVVVENCPVDAMCVVIDKLRETGLSIDETAPGTLHIKKTGTPVSVDVTTQPYPGFPTDMQAQFMAVMTVAGGVSVIRETIFENRFMHAAELKRMGADIALKESFAVIKGVERLSGAPVMASDLRASASLVVAALGAEGASEVRRVYHLDRGYEAFDRKLNALGADIKRVNDE